MVDARSSARSVVAVVVTYNRCELLRQTLRAIDAQTVQLARILVIDNASTDGTAEMLGGIELSTAVDVLRQPRNLGGAGGFKLGLRRAWQAGGEWFWCMDDDCLPAPEALARLLAVPDVQGLERPGFLASRVLWTDGSPCLMNVPVPHAQWFVATALCPGVSRIVGSSFVSILISRAAVDAVGLPVAEFFIWFDDAEYTRRIAARMPGYLVADSVVVHQTRRNSEPLSFAELDASSLWKFACGVRNECAYARRQQGWLAAGIFLARMMRRMAHARTPIRLRLRLLAAWLAGWRFDYTRYIEWPTPVEDEARHA